MTTKADMIAAIQLVADATGNNQIRIGLGAPGNHLENVIGETKATAAAWEPEPKAQPVIIEGLASWWDAGPKVKINEIIAAYMQLKADYNSGTVPTTAADVDPLP
jgi:hypothetical protein